MKTAQSSSDSPIYVDTDVHSSGKRPPSSESLQRDESSSADIHPWKKKSEKPQSPPNPFIFPSTFQGSAMDTEVRWPFTALHEPTQPGSSTSGSPRYHVITQNGAQPKQNKGKQDVVSAVPDNDLRPEVAKLPGRKRVASWGTQQEEDGHLTNGDNTDGVTSSDAAGGYSAVEPTRVHLPHNQLSDASSKSSSRIESRRSSVTNRKSWDGVRYPGESEEDQKVSRLERPQDNKERSCSDSNLMVRKHTVNHRLLPYGGLVRVEKKHSNWRSVAHAQTSEMDQSRIDFVNLLFKTFCKIKPPYLK